MGQSAEQTKIRFYNVDFLKFLFSIFIVLFHCKNCAAGYSLSSLLPGVVHWNICVDFFFIMSGFFLFKNIDKENDTLKFGIKRFFRLAPLIWFSLICCIILSIISNYHFHFENNILRCFLLSNIGFSPSKTEALVVHWFIPVLFWCSVFYFYISKIFEKKYLNLIIWLITIFSLAGYLNYRSFGTGGHSSIIYHFCCIGVMRGMFGIGIGYFINMLYNTNFLTNCSQKLKLCISGFEIFIVSFLTYYMIFTEKLPNGTGFCYIFLFSVLFFLFLRTQGILSNALNLKFFGTLGGYAYAIYIMHPVVIEYLYHLYQKSHITYVKQCPLVYIAAILTISVIAGILTHCFVEKKVNKLVKF